MLPVSYHPKETPARYAPYLKGYKSPEGPQACQLQEALREPSFVERVH